MFNLIASACAEETVATAVDMVEQVSKTSWFQTAFKKLIALPAWCWVLVAVLIIGGIVLMKAAKGSRKTVWTTRMLALGAMCLALTTVLGKIRLFSMPSGGSVTPASMLPLMLFAYVYGAGPGMILGALAGVLDYMLGGWFLNVPQFIVDYPLAFALCGLAGLTRSMKDTRIGLTIGVVLGSLGRYAAAVAAGVLFWADSAPEGMSPLVYSLGYNGTYMAIECIICVVLAVLMGERLVKALRQVK